MMKIWVKMFNLLYIFLIYIERNMKGVFIYMATVNKHFPADTRMEVLTFLNDKEIDGRLYGYLQSKSMPVLLPSGDQYQTRVDKYELGTQAKLCEAVKIKSPKTLRKHLGYLIEKGYVIDAGAYYVLPRKQNMYLNIPLNTLRFIQNVIKEDVIKIYIYLGQKNKYAVTLGLKYSFTITQIVEHLGLNSTSQSNRAMVKDGLDALMNCGLIVFKPYYEGRIPHLRLVEFNYEYLTNF